MIEASVFEKFAVERINLEHGRYSDPAKPLPTPSWAVSSPESNTAGGGC
ncbi:MAG: hypothetical protein ACI9W6_002525 [Motiliproteus sp.]|jgi:hypothetical protein